MVARTFFIPKVEANLRMTRSMTAPSVPAISINGRIRKRIAKGSGTRVQDVNKLLKSYTQVMQMVKKLNKGGMRGISRDMLPF